MAPSDEHRGQINPAGGVGKRHDAPLTEDQERFQRAREIRYVVLGGVRISADETPNTLTDAIENAAKKLLGVSR